MSLRARLLTGMVALVAAGLTVAAFVTYEEQRSFLLDRVDQQVQAALVPLAFQLRLDNSGARGCQGGAHRDSARRPRCRRERSAR
jgi:two-component system, OmpR family, sensor kinase